MEAVLCAALDGKALPARLPHGFVLETPERGAAVLHSGFPITRLYILLGGLCAATVYSEEGDSATADLMEPVQVFGVSELLQGSRIFHASIYAASDDCRLLSCPAPVFLSLLDDSLPLSRRMVRYLAQLMVRSMNRERERAFGSPRLAVAGFLYSASAAEPLPFTLRITRKEMAERLNLNLRTLYRHLSALREDGMLDIERGKIVVTEDAFLKLERLGRSSGME